MAARHQAGVCDAALLGLRYLWPELTQSRAQDFLSLANCAGWAVTADKAVVAQFVCLFFPQSLGPQHLYVVLVYAGLDDARHAQQSRLRPKGIRPAASDAG